MPYSGFLYVEIIEFKDLVMFDHELSGCHRFSESLKSSVGMNTIVSRPGDCEGHRK